MAGFYFNLFLFFFFCEGQFCVENAEWRFTKNIVFLKCILVSVNCMLICEYP